MRQYGKCSVGQGDIQLLQVQRERETKSGGRFHLTGGKSAGMPRCDLELQAVARQWCLVRRCFDRIGVGNGGWSEGKNCRKEN